MEAKQVLCTDPYVQSPDLVPLDVAIAQADVLILGVPHTTYRDLHIPADKAVVDIWNFWKPVQVQQTKPAPADLKVPAIS